MGRRGHRRVADRVAHAEVRRLCGDVHRLPETQRADRLATERRDGNRRFLQAFHALAGGDDDGFIQRGWVWPSGTFWFWTFVQAAGSLFGVGMMIRAYQMADASRVSVFEYVILPASAFWGWILWGEQLTPLAVTGMVLIAAAGVIIALRPAAPVASAVPAAPVSFAQVKTVLEQRCYMCHGEQVQMKNVRFDTADGVKQHALGIYQQAVVTKQMPMNNATGITEAERAAIKRWYEAGAALQ